MKRVGSHTRQLWGGAVAPARKHGLGVYDGACLDLAMRKGLPLATLDNALKNAASTVGARLFDAQIGVETPQGNLEKYHGRKFSRFP